MAILITPVIGRAKIDDKGKRSKVHLLKVNGSYYDAYGASQTVCNFLISAFPIEVAISSVDSADICERCLGAIMAVD
jgi:hypothetical protein